MAQTEAERYIARMLGGSSAWVISQHAAMAVASMAELPPHSVCVEALGGTPIVCADIKALGNDAHARNALLVVDISLPGVLACAANRQGADLAYARLTDEACVVCCSNRFHRAAPTAVQGLNEAALVDPFDTQAAIELIEEHDRSWRTSSDAAQVVASYVLCHPRVGELSYPGLRSDRSFVVAARTLSRGFGPIVDYRLEGQCSWNRVVCNHEDVRLQIMRLEAALATPLDITPPAL